MDRRYAKTGGQRNVSKRRKSRPAGLGSIFTRLTERRVTSTHSNLPTIPVVETDRDFPYATLLADEERAHMLIDGATRLAPRTALRLLDRISRRWLAKWNNAHLSEIDKIAIRLGRPGAYYLSVNYEWGCTVGVHASPDGSSARLGTQDGTTGPPPTASGCSRDG